MLEGRERAREETSPSTFSLLTDAHGVHFRLSSVFRPVKWNRQFVLGPPFARALAIWKVAANKHCGRPSNEPASKQRLYLLDEYFFCVVGEFQLKVRALKRFQTNPNFYICTTSASFRSLQQMQYSRRHHQLQLHGARFVGPFARPNTGIGQQAVVTR